jgi:hypothetical protein
MMTREAQLETLFPAIHWRSPVTIFVADDVTLLPPCVTGTKSKPTWGCRFCIAMYGVKGSEVNKTHPQSWEEFKTHMQTVHKLKATL